MKNQHREFIFKLKPAANHMQPVHVFSHVIRPMPVQTCRTMRPNPTGHLQALGHSRIRFARDEDLPNITLELLHAQLLIVTLRFVSKKDILIDISFWHLFTLYIRENSICHRLRACNIVLPVVLA